MSALIKAAVAAMIAGGSSGSGGSGGVFAANDYFSATTYTGTGAARSIATGVDLSVSSVANDNYDTSVANKGSFGGDDGSWYTFKSSGGMALSKLGANGWTNTFTSANSLNFGGGCADASGNSYFVMQENVSGIGYLSIFKFDTNGALLWQNRFSISGTFRYSKIATDGTSAYLLASGDVTLAYVLKLNGNTGSLTWQRQITAAGSCTCSEIICANSSLYVGGSANDLNFSNNVSFINKLDPSTGASQAIAKWYSSDSGVQSLAFSPAGDLYAISNTGGSQKYHITKHNASTLALVWQKIVNGQAVNQATQWTASIAAGTYVHVRIFYNDSTSPAENYWTLDSSGNVLNSASSGLTSYSGVAGVNLLSMAGGNVHASKGTYVMRWKDADMGGVNHPVNTVAATLTIAASTAFVTATVTVGSQANASAFAVSNTVTATVASVALPYNTQISAASGGGGLLMIKQRNASNPIVAFDSMRGASSLANVSSTAAPTTASDSVTGFTPTGLTLGADAANAVNTTAAQYVAWSFKRAAKFFDMVVYSGDGNAARAIPHALGVKPGMIVVKRIDSAENWQVYLNSTGATKRLYLNTYDTPTSADPAIQASSNTWAMTEPTSTNFYVGDTSANPSTNATGCTYVAYLWAHDTDTANGIIQCGYYTEPASGSLQVDLGWEPQFIMFKPITVNGQWYIADSQRGFNLASCAAVFTSSTGAESDQGVLVNPTSNGFTAKSAAFGSGIQVMYLAIRRSMRKPTAATQVYNAVLNTGNSASKSITTVGFSPDLVLSRARTGSINYAYMFDRVRGNNLGIAAATAATEATYTNSVTDLSVSGGYAVGSDSSNTVNISGNTYVHYAIKRARGFFDIASWNGDGVTSRTVKHNLGVAPEMIWLKRRESTVDAGSFDSAIYVVIKKSDGNGAWIDMKTNTTPLQTADWNTSSYGLNDPDKFIPWGVTVRSASGPCGNVSGGKYLAYLFASLPGISKVGSYTGTNAALNIECGFSNGARFVLVRRLDASANWYLFDTARGIVASGNDPFLGLTNASSEITNENVMEPYAGGFKLNANTASAGLNASGGTYAFFAIA